MSDAGKDAKCLPLMRLIGPNPKNSRQLNVFDVMFRLSKRRSEND
jgi:hypothetical protein